MIATLRQSIDDKQVFKSQFFPGRWVCWASRVGLLVFHMPNFVDVALDGEAQTFSKSTRRYVPCEGGAGGTMYVQAASARELLVLHL